MTIDFSSMQGLQRTCGEMKHTGPSRLRTDDARAAGESGKNLLPLYRTLYEEARALAVTKEDKTIVNHFLYKMDLIELPYEEVLKRTDERSKALCKEFPEQPQHRTTATPTTAQGA